MTERDYAIRSFKEITLNAAQHILIDLFLTLLL